MPTTNKNYFHYYFLVLSIISSIATASDFVPEGVVQEQYQEQKSERIRQKNLPDPLVVIDPKKVTPAQPLVVSITETNDVCFDISTVSLVGKQAEHFQFALKPLISGKASVINQCLNVNAINQLVYQVQNNVIDKGYATTRVVIQNQNLNDGSLEISIIPGYINQIRSKEADPRVVRSNGGLHTLPSNIAPALVAKEGELLNIRDLEQTLENLKRVPTADANFEIIPSHQDTRPGYSDIVIDYKQDKWWRVSATIDDSGQESTGKYQSNLTLSLDNPTKSNDLLYISLVKNLDNIHNNKKDDSLSYNLGYSVPYKKALFTLTYNTYDYDQTVVGDSQNYVYSGKSVGTDASLSYVVHRNNHSKTKLKMGGYYKEQKNYIDDTEVEVQHRRTAGWKVAVAYDTSISNAQIKSELEYRHGTGAFGSILPPESLFDEGSARTGIYKLNIVVDEALSNKLRYRGVIRGQFDPCCQSHTPKQGRFN